MAFGGAVLRISQTLLRAIQLCASILVLGVFSYFLARLSNNDLPIATWIKAVEGMSGAAVLYGIFAVLLTLFLGGIAIFAFIAIVLDLCFVGCFAAIAYYNRGGANSCSGNVNTPLGDGPADRNSPSYGQNRFGFGNTGNADYAPNLHLACQLETAVFAVAIVNIFLFLVTAVMQVLLVRHHKKEKRYGPSPANNYTKGAGKRPFWKRNKKTNARDAEMATAGTATTGAIRPSHDTGYTGSTVGGVAEPKYGQPAYLQPTNTQQPYNTVGQYPTGGVPPTQGQPYGQTAYGPTPTHARTTAATNY